MNDLEKLRNSANGGMLVPDPETGLLRCDSDNLNYVITQTEISILSKEELDEHLANLKGPNITK